ncbi:hypothetical protein BH10ACI1_BH10ACI1_23920 [soil metagenome]
MNGNKKAQEIAEDLGKLYQDAIDSMEIGDYYAHFCMELRIAKKWYENNSPGALSAEKIAALEKAVEEFNLIYEAEKAEAEKMPISWHEARRVLKLFEDAEDRFNPPPDSRIEH